MASEQQERSAKADGGESRAIAVLNDKFRTTFTGGRVLLTQGVSELPAAVIARVLLMVQSFSKFDRGSDPHEEHDFGSFETNDQQFFWKIDYYDLNCEFGSEDPANPEVTSRVLTIMLAEEY